MIRLDAVTLRQLRAFCHVAECQSLTLAAERLGVTVPAVHSQLRNLEEAFGMPLLRRGKDQSWGALTDEGRVLLEAARRIDVMMVQTANRIEALASGQAGTVRIGVVSTARYFAPRLMRLLRDALPEIELRLVEANREGVIRALDEASVDLAVMGRPPRLPALEAIVIGPHPHGLLAPATHPLAGREVAPADLDGETFLAREEGSGTRILMQRFLDGLDDGRPHALVEMASNETIKQAAMAGLGLAFLSLHTVQEELAAGRLVCLDVAGLPIVRHWFLVHPVQSPPGPAARRIWDATLALGGAFLPGVIPAGSPR